MRALVTGGAGFIGSHLVDALAERGDEVLVLDDLSTGRRENLAGALDRGARLEEVDVGEAAAVRSTATAFVPEAVFHLAALVDIRSAGDDAERLGHVNVHGTQSALEAARDAGARRFVLASTAGVYADGAENPESLPFGEETSVSPPSAYGRSKLAGEQLLESFRGDGGVSGVALRFANVYGPRQDPANEAGVVAVFCARARDGERPVVYGDGSQTRDYIYVGDVVEALIAAQAADAAGPLNVATGVETSVLELAAEIGRMAGRDDFEPEHTEARPVGVARSALDPSAAESELGWRATHSLRDGLAKTLAAEEPG
jgi:UDP-glucose 4-epimerase